MGKNYQFVDLTEFYNLAKNDFKDVLKPVAHLSFDDGLIECFELIYSILKSKGIPATFFVNSSFVNRRKMFFRFKASLLIESLYQQNIKDKRFKKEILDLEYSDEQTLNELASNYDLDFNEYLNSNRIYMTGAQIQVLSDNGFSIGGHSADHPEFRLIDEDEAINQVSESMLDVASYCDHGVKAFSFPFTDYQLKLSFFEKVRDLNLVDISFGTAGIKNDEAEMNFQRVPMEFNYDAKEIIGYYKLKSYARRFVGKNTIKR